MAGRETVARSVAAASIGITTSGGSSPGAAVQRQDTLFNNEDINVVTAWRGLVAALHLPLYYFTRFKELWLPVVFIRALRVLSGERINRSEDAYQSAIGLR